MISTSQIDEGRERIKYGKLMGFPVIEPSSVKQMGYCGSLKEEAS